MCSHACAFGVELLRGIGGYEQASGARLKFAHRSRPSAVWRIQDGSYPGLGLPDIRFSEDQAQSRLWWSGWYRNWNTPSDLIYPTGTPARAGIVSEDRRQAGAT